MTIFDDEVFCQSPRPHVKGRSALRPASNAALRPSYSLVMSVRRNAKPWLCNAALLGRFLPKLRTPVNFVRHRGFFKTHTHTNLSVH